MMQAEDEAKQKDREEVKAARQRHAQNLSGNRHAQNLLGDPRMSQNPPAQPRITSLHPLHPPSGSPALTHPANEPQGHFRVPQGAPGPHQGLPIRAGDSRESGDAGQLPMREPEGHLQEITTSLGMGYQEGAGPAASLQDGGDGEGGLPDEDALGRSGTEPGREIPIDDGRNGAEPRGELIVNDGRTLAEVFRGASSGLEVGKRKRGEKQGAEQSRHVRDSNPGLLPEAGSRAGFAALYPPTRRVVKRKEYSKLRKLKKKGRVGEEQEPDLETELLLDRYKPKFGEQALAPPTVGIPSCNLRVFENSKFYPLLRMRVHSSCDLRINTQH